MRITGIVILFLGSYLLGGAQEPAIDLDSIQVNQFDDEGRKVGPWIYYAKDKPAYLDKGYEEEQILECGEYNEGRKYGNWTRFYPDGVKKSIIHYKYNRPRGPYILYYPDGMIKQSGTWDGAGFIGEYVSYYPSGCMEMYKEFGGDGRCDTSVYYLDDCDPDQELRGTVEVSLSGNSRTDDSVTTFEGYPVGVHLIKPKVEDKYNPGRADSTGTYDCLEEGQPCSGYYRVLNRNMDVTIEGEFKDGVLWEGKKYLYDEQGLLKKVVLFKDGEYYGDGVLEF